LRADAHAQYEIRVYADTILTMVQAWVPAAYEAFQDYRLGAVTFSARMLAVLRRMLAGETVVQDGSGLSKREWSLADAPRVIGRRGSNIPRRPRPRFALSQREIGC
jgi:hypothetical protein